MPARVSAGVLLHRIRDGQVEVFLGHMGGPFWARKEAAAWTIPKGELGVVEHLDDDDIRAEDPLTAALREFEEETGHPVPAGPLLPLGAFRQRNGKVIHVWTVAGDVDPSACRSNTFSVEWPPRSGRQQEFPELDRFAWFDLPAARVALVAGQVPILDALRAALPGS